MVQEELDTVIIPCSIEGPLQELALRFAYASVTQKVGQGRDRKGGPVGLTEMESIPRLKELDDLCWNIDLLPLRAFLWVLTTVQRNL